MCHDIYDIFPKKAYNVENVFEQEYLKFIIEHEKHIPTLDETLHLLKRDMDSTYLKNHPIDFLRLLSELVKTDNRLVYEMPKVGTDDEIRLVSPKNFTKKQAIELLEKHYNGEDAVLSKGVSFEKIKDEMLESHNEFCIKYVLANDDDSRMRLKALDLTNNKTVIVNVAFNDDDDVVRLEAMKKIGYDPVLLIELIDHEENTCNKKYLQKLLVDDEGLYDFIIKDNPDITEETLIDNFNEKYDHILADIRRKNDLINLLSEKIEDESENKKKEVINEYENLIDKLTSDHNYSLETITDEELLKAIIRYHSNQTIRIKAMKNMNIRDEDFLKEMALNSNEVYLRKLAVLNPHMNDKQTLMDILLHEDEDYMRKAVLDNVFFDDVKTLLYIKDNDKNDEIRKKAMDNYYLKDYMLDQ